MDLFNPFLLADTVRKEAATITAVFPSPNDVMSILVQVLTGSSFVLEMFDIAVSSMTYYDRVPVLLSS